MQKDILHLLILSLCGEPFTGGCHSEARSRFAPALPKYASQEALLNLETNSLQPFVISIKRQIHIQIPKQRHG